MIGGERKGARKRGGESKWSEVEEKKERKDRRREGQKRWE